MRLFYPAAKPQGLAKYLPTCLPTYLGTKYCRLIIPTPSAATWFELLTYKVELSVHLEEPTCLNPSNDGLLKIGPDISAKNK